MEVSIEARLLLRSDSHNDVPMVVPCRIVDVSEGGVRVQVGVRYRLPPRVFLLRDENERMYECQTAWQHDRAVSLVFVEVCGHGQHEELLKEVRTAQVVEKANPFDLS